MTDPKRIFLQPRCATCCPDGDREWCPDDVWGGCEMAGCDVKSVEYVRADAEPAHTLPLYEFGNSEPIAYLDSVGATSAAGYVVERGWQPIETAPRDAVLAAALEALVMACELPGDHCEVAQALPAARTALAASDAAFAGYVVRPREPTKAMVDAAVEADDNRTGAETCKHIYRAMIAEGEKK